VKILILAGNPTGKYGAQNKVDLARVWVDAGAVYVEPERPEFEQFADGVHALLSERMLKNHGKVFSMSGGEATDQNDSRLYHAETLHISTPDMPDYLETLQHDTVMWPVDDEGAIAGFEVDPMVSRIINEEQSANKIKVLTVVGYEINDFDHVLDLLQIWQDPNGGFRIIPLDDAYIPFRNVIVERMTIRLQGKDPAFYAPGMRSIVLNGEIHEQHQSLRATRFDDDVLEVMIGDQPLFGGLTAEPIEGYVVHAGASRIEEVEKPPRPPLEN
jgi:hypothetical protein